MRPTEPIPRWASYGLLAAGAGAASIVMMGATLPIMDPDVWWVAAAGRETLAHGLLRTNFFSFTAPSTPWVMHEWLLGPLYAALLGASPSMLAVLVLSVMSACWAMSLAGTVRRTKHAGVGIAWALASLPALFHLASPRPTVVARALALAMTLLAFGPRFELPHAIGAAALALVWANAHGSFPLGIAMLACAAWAALERADRARAARLAWTTAAALALSFCTPHGLALHALVAGYATGAGATSSLIHEGIVEFWPLHRAVGPMGLALECTVLAAFVVIAALLLRRERARPLFALGLAGLSLLQARHTMLALLLIPVLLAEPFDRWASERWPRGPSLGVREIVALSFVPMLALGAAGLILTIVRQPAAYWLDETIGGPELDDVVRALPDGARVHAPFAWSARVLWLGTERDVRVAYDSRNDCYPADVARRAMEIDDARAGPEGTIERLDAEGAQFVVTDAQGPLALVLRGASYVELAPRGHVATFRRR